MNLADVRLLYVKELRSAFRERSIVVNTIVIPIVLYPLLIWLAYTAFSYVSGQLENTRSRIDVAQGIAGLDAVRRDMDRDEAAEWTPFDGDPETGLRDGTIDLAVRQSRDGGLELLYDASRDASTLALRRFDEALDKERTRRVGDEARRLGTSEAELLPFWIESRNVSTGEQMGQFILGLMLPAMMVVMLGVGCVHPAVDSTAGERENRTWETTMTTATDRVNIIVAKYLYVASMSLLAGLLNLVAMLMSVRSMLAPLLGSDAGGMTFQIPLQSIPVMVVTSALLAMFIAAGMMILASFARTFKDGQSMAGPFIVALILPVTFLQSTGNEFTVQLALIPVVNVSMVYRQAITGIYDWPLIGLTLLSEAVCIAIALRVSQTILKYEDFVTGSYSGNLGRFLKERLFGGR